MGVFSGWTDDQLRENIKLGEMGDTASGAKDVAQDIVDLLEAADKENTP